jgi:hypothetical protein
MLCDCKWLPARIPTNKGQFSPIFVSEYTPDPHKSFCNAGGVTEVSVMIVLMVLDEFQIEMKSKL